MEKVSIIVPVYNVESYLEECLDSLVNQTFTDMEIIIIDDGSTDRSLEIMKTYASKDKRIVLSTQSNNGVSAARNKGLTLATGVYVLFVDSDDKIELDSVEKLYQQIIKTGSDIIIGSAMYLYPGGSKSKYLPRYNDMKQIDNISGDSCFNQLMQSHSFPPVVYLFFIRYDYIKNNQLYFKEGIVHEYELWCIKAMLLSSNISLIDFDYYYYRQREGSIMNSDNKEFRAYSLFVVIKELHSFLLNAPQAAISKTSIGYVYVRILFFYYKISDLLHPSNPFLLLCTDYISELLIEIYSELSYSQQRSCLINYYIAKMTINELFKK